jgi:hypothetical protein
MVTDFAVVTAATVANVVKRVPLLNVAAFTE